MKTIQLIGINAKFSHTCLAIRALRGVASLPVTLTELTINEPLSHSAQRILSQPADIYGFSCSIWNMTTVALLAEMVKLSQPNCEIYLGGPEVSYDPQKVLEDHPYVDGVFCGEGEAAFRLFCEAVAQEQTICGIPGLQLREGLSATVQVVQDLADLPFPYSKEELSELKDRILYYESMRGCPFCCGYCLSSTLPGGVRCRALDQVKTELQCFMDGEVRQVKFVDRTFNCLKDRAKAILSFLAEAETKTNFHFEIAADLLDDEMIRIIAQAPKGRFQFEIGIQSTHMPTLQAVTRKTDLSLVKDRIVQLLKIGNSHVHVDLIAGLPYEDLETFRHSYNETMALNPHMLQLGFLKLLKGTSIRTDARNHGYRFCSFPPYEVIANDYISAEELRLLKGVETLTEAYYNSGAFETTMAYLFKSGVIESPFDFFVDFWHFWQEQGHHLVSHSQESLYALIGGFIVERTGNILIWDFLIYDALIRGMSHLPRGVPTGSPLKKEACFEIAKRDQLFREYFPVLADFAPKKRIKFLRIHQFSEAFARVFKTAGTVGVFCQGQAVFVPAIST